MATKRKKKPPLSPAVQRKRFIALAEKLETAGGLNPEEGAARLERAFKKIVPPKRK